MKRTHVKAKYGITPDERKAIMEWQDGRCYVCRVRMTTPWRQSDAPVVHHRGRYVIALLCNHCNMYEEPKRWKAWSERGVIPDGAWRDLITTDSARWPATRALGRVLDTVPADNWKGCAWFRAV